MAYVTVILYMISVMEGTWNRMNNLIKELINAADKAIKEECFASLMDFYTKDAVLVVKPGLEVKGKDSIKKAFIKIAEYFKKQCSS